MQSYLDPAPSGSPSSGGSGWNPFDAVGDWWNGLSTEAQVFIIVAVVVILVLIILAPFTGGQSLWGILIFV